MPQPQIEEISDYDYNPEEVEKPDEMLYFYGPHQQKQMTVQEWEDFEDYEGDDALMFVAYGKCGTLFEMYIRDPNAN